MPAGSWRQGDNEPAESGSREGLTGQKVASITRLKKKVPLATAAPMQLTANRANDKRKDDAGRGNRVNKSIHDRLFSIAARSSSADMEMIF